MNIMQYILSAETIRAIENDAFAKGVDSFAVMHRAAEAVCSIIKREYKDRPVVVLAGCGNNGGDGLVIASLLRHIGIGVKVYALDKAKIKGDAKKALKLYGEANALSISALDLTGSPVVVDALFGIGLTRELGNDLVQLVNVVNNATLDVVAVDVPSGVEADSGKVLGAAINASVTVTFIAKKFAHVLMPARGHCGRVVVDGIGLSPGNYEYSSAYENLPCLWQHQLKWPTPDMHKYDRGHALVAGGPAAKAGAAKLAALAAMRAGAGLATIVCAEQDMPVYASMALSVMTAAQAQWNELLADKRVTSVVLGPGMGAGDATRAKALDALSAQKSVVLDADAITSFAQEPQSLFTSSKSRCILTPHGAEFARLFADLAALPRQHAALKAAERSHCVVILKGYDTIIASPDGRRAVNTNAPPTLATAGSGDVLAGICGGLLAQGMEAFEAACAAVWLHSEAAAMQGDGLIAEDILNTLPKALQTLRNYGKVTA